MTDATRLGHAPQVVAQRCVDAGVNILKGVARVPTGRAVLCSTGLVLCVAAISLTIW